VPSCEGRGRGEEEAREVVVVDVLAGRNGNGCREVNGQRAFRRPRIGAAAEKATIADDCKHPHLEDAAGPSYVARYVNLKNPAKRTVTPRAHKQKRKQIREIQSAIETERTLLGSKLI